MDGQRTGKPAPTAVLRSTLGMRTELLLHRGPQCRSALVGPYPQGFGTKQHGMLSASLVSQRMRIGITAALLGAVALGACAGRDPQPVATVQMQDQTAGCTQITAEIQANNIKVQELAEEQGLKTGQNVAMGVAGIFIPVLWFGMDFKGAASKDVAALQARQQYLAMLATERCAQRGSPQQRQR